MTAARASMIFSITSDSGMPWAADWSAIWLSTSAVRTYAGLMQLAVTPCAAPSNATTFDSPSSACFAET
ncbi:hypothetical protein GCM10029963_20020 [Micromonospora andamanensis]